MLQHLHIVVSLEQAFRQSVPNRLPLLDDRRADRRGHVSRPVLVLIAAMALGVI